MGSYVVGGEGEGAVEAGDGPGVAGLGLRILRHPRLELTQMPPGDPLVAVGSYKIGGEGEGAVEASN